MFERPLTCHRCALAGSLRQQQPRVPTPEPGAQQHGQTGEAAGPSKAPWTAAAARAPSPAVSPPASAAAGAAWVTPPRPPNSSSADPAPSPQAGRPHRSLDVGRRASSAPHHDNEDDASSSGEEWEPGAYGLVDIPQKPRYKRMNDVVPSSHHSGARSSAAAHQSHHHAAPPRQPAAAAPRTPGLPSAAGSHGPAAMRHRRDGIRSHPSTSDARRPPQAPAQPRSISPSVPGFPFASLQLPVGGNSTAGAPPVLQLLPGQLRAQRVAAQRQESVERLSLSERQDSATAFGSELSYKGD